ncbi:MAG: GNAT family N-acetyltransferase [Butyrivibrio sp.]|nr:GNAT family N-acetyltransferase [Butyrivibrio sp.]
MWLEKLSKSQVESIYREKMVVDFPAAEIKPLEAILKAMDKGLYESFGLYDEAGIMGYTFLVKIDRDYLVDYLAVFDGRRNNGAGSQMIRLLAEYLKDADNIILEVENPDFADDQEKELQTRRYNFYKRNGCSDTGLRVRCFGVPFRIIRMNRNFSKDHDSLWALYQSFYRMMLPKELFEKNLERM